MEPTFRPVTIYAAVYSLPGCLSDCPEDVAYFSTEDGAEQYVAQQEEEYEGEGDDPYGWDIIPFHAWKDGFGSYFEEDHGDYYPLIVY